MKTTITGLVTLLVNLIPETIVPKAVKEPLTSVLIALGFWFCQDANKK